MPTLTVPRRFNGPAHSGNGGWTAGALAATLPGALERPITVRLHLPPPLDTPMPVAETANGAVATHQGRTVAEAQYAESDPHPVPAATIAEASAAQQHFAGLHEHPFPSCFVCGTARRPDDGLLIHPGRLAARGRVAATWTPYAVTVPITWGALDCPGAWATDLTGRAMVLGTITVRINALPRTSERYVVTAADRGSEGRKTFTASTLYAPDGTAIATAEHVWITVDPQRFG